VVVFEYNFVRRDIHSLTRAVVEKDFSVSFWQDKQGIYYSILLKKMSCIFLSGLNMNRVDFFLFGRNSTHDHIDCHRTLKCILNGFLNEGPE
jgi:hypothetical protein